MPLCFIFKLFVVAFESGFKCSMKYVTKQNTLLNDNWKLFTHICEYKSLQMEVFTYYSYKESVLCSKNVLYSHMCVAKCCQIVIQDKLAPGKINSQIVLPYSTITSLSYCYRYQDLTNTMSTLIKYRKTYPCHSFIEKDIWCQIRTIF